MEYVSVFLVAMAVGFVVTCAAMIALSRQEHSHTDLRTRPRYVKRRLNYGPRRKRTRETGLADIIRTIF